MYYYELWAQICATDTKNLFILQKFYTVLLVHKLTLHYALIQHLSTILLYDSMNLENIYILCNWNVIELNVLSVH
jgi:hypothetical protein